MSINTSASRVTLVTVKILMVMLQGLSLSVFATPLIWEPEWSAIVVPITQSPATARQSRLTAQSKDFRWWNHLVTLTNSKSAGTVTEAPHLYSTCRGFSCRDLNRSKNRNIEDRHDENRQETKRSRNNHHGKNRCGGKNQQNKPGGKNQHQKHCDKNQCEKRCGKNQGKKHCGEKRNGQRRHDTTNCNRQNNRKNNMKTGNKRRQFVVDNKVIVNVNDGRTPDPTVINGNDGRTSDSTVINFNDGRTSDSIVINGNDGRTLLPRIDTTVAAVQQVSIVPRSVGHFSCSSFYRFRHTDIILWLYLLAICVAITFCIYKVYFITDRYHSIMY